MAQTKHWKILTTFGPRCLVPPLARSSSLAAELIKQAEQWLLILLVYIQIWHSFTSIKLRSCAWHVAEKTASCGSGSLVLKCWSALLQSVSSCLLFASCYQSVAGGQLTFILPPLLNSILPPRPLKRSGKSGGGNGSFQCESHICVFGFFWMISWDWKFVQLTTTPPAPPLPARTLCLAALWERLMWRRPPHPTSQPPLLQRGRCNTEVYETRLIKGNSHRWVQRDILWNGVSGWSNFLQVKTAAVLQSLCERVHSLLTFAWAPRSRSYTSCTDWGICARFNHLAAPVQDIHGKRLSEGRRRREEGGGGREGRVTGFQEPFCSSGVRWVGEARISRRLGVHSSCLVFDNEVVSFGAEWLVCHAFLASTSWKSILCWQQRAEGTTPIRKIIIIISLTLRRTFSPAPFMTKNFTHQHLGLQLSEHPFYVTGWNLTPPHIPPCCHYYYRQMFHTCIAVQNEVQSKTISPLYQ